MAETIIVWPTTILKPAQMLANIVPFTRTGGTTLSGLSRNIRTNRGSWSIVYNDIPLFDSQRRKAWNALRIAAMGMAGLLAVPVWSYDLGVSPTTVRNINSAAVGATSIVIETTLVPVGGIRFSYLNALYEVGDGVTAGTNRWTVPILPAVRAVIPNNVLFQVALPTCLVRMTSDREMDTSLTAGGFDMVKQVVFREATDYWTDLLA